MLNWVYVLRFECRLVDWQEMWIFVCLTKETFNLGTLKVCKMVRIWGEGVGDPVPRLMSIQWIMVSALGTEHSTSQLVGEHLSVYGTKQVRKYKKRAYAFCAWEIEPICQLQWPRKERQGNSKESLLKYFVSKECIRFILNINNLTCLKCKSDGVFTVGK